MRIAVTGSTGLVGSALVAFLQRAGDQVVPIVRSQPSTSAATWNPAEGTIDAGPLQGCDAVVHLAGENIAARRWSKTQKQRIRDSRVDGTRLLCNALAAMQQKPRVLVSAGAIGFYGDRGGAEVDEDSPGGAGFLADVCREWEAACEPARDAGMRVVNLRMGVILSPKGGALSQMLTPFRLGLGGILGSGQQYWSWVTLDDVVRAFHHALLADSLSGPVNVVAPGACTNEEFTRSLGRVLKRPTVLPLPAPVARLVLGEMANELLLASTRVTPTRLLSSGYRFLHPELEPALQLLLQRPSS